MNTDLTSKQVKCRKPHRCDWCGESIESGETAHYRSGIHNDEFFSGHLHMECWDALGRSDLGFDDEFYPMDQKRGETFEESHE